MRTILLPALLLISAAVCAQPKEISIIDFYGRENIPEQHLRSLLPVKEGDSIRLVNKEAIVKKLKEVPGVSDAHVATVCCDEKDGKWILFVGISEGIILRPPYNPAPNGKATLPEDVMKNYAEFNRLFMEGVMKGEARQESGEGHAIFTYAPAKPAQEKLIAYTRQNLAHVKDVLRNSADANQRDAASWIIAYAADKKSIVPDLLEAVYDADEKVRNNATRGLAVLAGWAAKKPDAGIQIPAEPFINMTNSIVWTDRNKGIAVLLALSENAPEEVKKKIITRALPAIVEMSKWKNPGHALMNYMLLARMAGMPEGEIEPTFFSDRKDASINEMAQKLRGY